MRFTDIDINFDVRYEGHQNCPKILSMNILSVFSDHHLWRQNWRQYLWTSLCQFNFFVNLLHSLGVSFFDIWHHFDNLTSFWQLDIFLIFWEQIAHGPLSPCAPYPCTPSGPHCPCAPYPCTPLPMWPIAYMAHTPCAPLPIDPIPLYPIAHTPCTPYLCAHVPHTLCAPITHVAYTPCTPYPMYTIAPLPITPVPHWVMGHMGNGGNGVQGVWATWAMGLWAMWTHGALGYRGYGAHGQRPMGKVVQGVWGT